MKTLYIIGNGFDLWHGLPTAYKEFYKYAKKFLDEMEVYYSRGDGSDIPWNDFEYRLGTYDWQSFYEEYNGIDVTSESFRPSHVYGLEDELTEKSEGMVEAIKGQFMEWISDIDVSAAAPKCSFRSNAQFLTFNYTSTLQEVYKVPDSLIMHIHGNCSKYDDLIFGHGQSMEEEPDYDENGENTRTMFTDAESAAKSPFYDFKKPVDEIIKNNRSYFLSLSSCSEIVVLGHSINDIDLPYYCEVAKSAAGARWVIYCYNVADGPRFQCQIERCGVQSGRIEIRPYH